MEIELSKLRCGQCGHVWSPRKEDVRQCPNCKSAYWDALPISDIEAARITRGVSREDLARKIRISPEELEAIEKGRSKGNKSIFDAIKAVLGDQ